MVEPDFDDATCSVRSGGHSVGDPGDGRRDRVVSSTWRRGTAGRRLEGAGQHLGEQARPAHAHDEHVVDAVDQLVARARAGAGRSPSTSPHDRDPAEPVGELGRVVAPERVVAVEQPADRVALDQVGEDRVGGPRRTRRRPATRRRSCDRTRRRRARRRRSRRRPRRCGPGRGTAPRRRRGQGHAAVEHGVEEGGVAGRVGALRARRSRPAPRRRSRGRRASATCGTTAAMPAVGERAAQVAGQALGGGA